MQQTGPSRSRRHSASHLSHLDGYLDARDGMRSTDATRWRQEMGMMSVGRHLAYGMF